MKEDADDPGAEAPRWWHRVWRLDGDSGRPRRTRELLVLLVLLAVYLTSRWIAVGDPAANARAIFDIEMALGMDWEASWQAWMVQHPALREAMSWYYMPGHHLPFFGLLFWHLAGWTPAYWPVRNAVVSCIAIGYIGYIFLPTAPPRVIPEAGVSDQVTGGSGPGFDNSFVEFFANQNAAFPSEHAAWAVVAAWGWARFHPRWLIVLGLAHVVWMNWLIVATGHHFVLDAVAGLFVGGVAVLFGERTLSGRWLWQRVRTEPDTARPIP